MDLMLVVKGSMPDFNRGPAMTFRHWLVERSASERETLARLWAAPGDLAPTPGALADALLRPEVIGRVLAALAPRARAALACVQASGDVIAAKRLEREFGAVRAHADYPNPRAYLLALDASPSPTEQLYLLGMLQLIHDGSRRCYAIPPDLAALLPPAPRRDATLQLAPTAIPPTIAPAEARGIERSLIVLLLLANHGQIEVVPTGGLNKASMVRLARQWNPHSVLQGVSREEHWPYAQFLRCIAVSAALLRVGADARLRPTKAALGWMQSPAVERTRALLDGWVASDWDELASLLGMTIQHPFARDLRGARSAILQLLGQVSPGAWIAFDAFVAAVKQAVPDFARPDGDYESWGISGRYRQPLDGFAHWGEVEGRQLRAIVGGTLRWLGLIDLGMHGDEPVSFRINPLGAALLGSGPALAEPPVAPLVIQSNLEVVVPADASPYAWFQIGRVAERVGNQQAVSYRLTKRSLQAALERGISCEDILQALREQSGRELPPNVVETLQEWAGQYGQLLLRRGVLIEAADAALLDRIRRDRRIRLGQVEQLTDTTWLVREGDAPALAERLRKAGYGLAGDVGDPRTPLRDHDLTMLFAALEFYIHACMALGIDGMPPGALYQRIARLLPEKQIDRAFQTSHEALALLRERLGTSQ